MLFEADSLESLLCCCCARRSSLPSLNEDVTCPAIKEEGVLGGKYASPIAVGDSCRLYLGTAAVAATATTTRMFRCTSPPPSLIHNIVLFASPPGQAHKTADGPDRVPRQRERARSNTWKEERNTGRDATEVEPSPVKSACLRPVRAKRGGCFDPLFRRQIDLRRSFV